MNANQPAIHEEHEPSVALSSAWASSWLTFGSRGTWNMPTPALVKEWIMGRNWVVLFLATLIIWSQVEMMMADPSTGSILDCAPQASDFSMLWWAHGWNETGPVRPLHLCLQSGSYGMVLDAETLTLPHLGLLEEKADLENTFVEKKGVLHKLPEGKLDLQIEVDGKKFSCLAGAIGWQDRDRLLTFPVRIVQSGPFLQHFQIHGLIFEEPEGGQLPAEGWLDVMAFPHKFRLSLHIIPEESWKDGEMRIDLRSQGKIQYNGKSRDKWTGSWDAGEERNLSLHVSFAMEDDLEENEDLSVSYRQPGQADWIETSPGRDRKLFHRVDLPHQSWTPEEDPDHLERIQVRVINRGTTSSVVPILFCKEYPFPGITGMCPMIRDPAGHPTGIPVQLSKNWHRQEETRLPHEGPWFRGTTLLRVPAKSEIPFEFAICYAQWGGVPAASHAQLSLIGWGTNQFWDQAAIGCWGETICYEPDACQRRCMIDDIRPLMVTSMNADTPHWTWTHNVGGGDFLLYINQDREYVHHKEVKTWYRSIGPNLTDVRYSGITNDETIAFVVTTSLPRSDDHVRVFHTLRYDVKKEVHPSRLALYQMGADHYNEGKSRFVAIGHENGVEDVFEGTKGSDGYERQSIPWTGQVPWVCLHHSELEQEIVGAWANRGLILRHWHARLGGRDRSQAMLSIYRSNASKTPNPLIEISLPEDCPTLFPGDFVEAQIEMVVLPVSAKDYYGPNRSFKSALQEAREPWELVLREAVGNQLSVEMRTGHLVKTYPLEVEPKEGYAAEWLVRGGLGHVPVTLKGLPTPVGYELLLQEGSDWVPLNQAVHGKDFWQATRNVSDGTWDLTFNLPLVGPDPRGLALNHVMP